MALFDELIADLGSRFGFGEKAEALLKELVGLIKDHPDGLAGFLNQFKTAGYGEQVASWVGDSDGAPLSSAQVEKTLGHGVVAAIARKLALDTGAAGEAIGYALPKLVGVLTPDGIVPKALPASITGLLSPPPRLPEALARPAVTYPARDSKRDNSAGPWAVPFFLLVAVALLTYYYPTLYNNYYPLLIKALAPAAEAPKVAETAPAPAAAPAAEPAPPAPVAATPEATPAASAPAATAPAVPAPVVPAPVLAPAAPAQLRLDRANGVLSYSGSLDSAASRDEVVSLLKDQFGPDHVKGDISVDPNIAPPAWLADLKQALTLFKSPSWHAAFDGASLEVGAQKGGDKLVAGLKSLYGSVLTISGVAAEAGAPTAETNRPRPPWPRSSPASQAPIWSRS